MKAMYNQRLPLPWHKILQATKKESINIESTVNNVQIMENFGTSPSVYYLFKQTIVPVEHVWNYNVAYAYFDFFDNKKKGSILFYK